MTMTMKNLIPNIEAVAARFNPLRPLYMVQTFYITAVDGG
jgi:hypothetical protein